MMEATDTTALTEDNEGSSLPTHVEKRTIASPDLKVLYTPVPKASCTAILWKIAELSGLEAENFTTSAGREVTRALTIHHMARWPESFRFGQLPGSEAEEILGDDGWMRFTVVRHPFRRIWSAWQSKLLLNEPQFAEKFGDRDWYPRAARSADEVLAAFREFLQALESDPELVTADVHWAPQVDLIGHGIIDYTHIGKVEDLDETIQRLREHVKKVKGEELAGLPRANQTPLPYADELFTEDDIRILGKAYAKDLEAFGYDVPAAKALEGDVTKTWRARVDAAAPAVQELRLRNERVADLQEAAQSRQTRQAERIKELRERVQDQRQKIQQQNRLRREEIQRNQRLQTRLSKAQRENEKMRESLSWRITAPLRRGGDAARKLKSRFGAR